MSTLIRRSFAGGEIAPSVYARADQSKYQTGLRTCRNFIIMRHGGASSRSGTGLSGETKDSSKFSRFIKFVFNAAQTYALEFGHLYMRIHKNGSQVLEASKAITGITQANPAVVTSAGHGYSTGDEIVVSGISGMTELNGRNLKVVLIDPNTYSLKYLDGPVVDSSAFTAYSTGGITERVYELITPYVEADLRTLQYVQSADVITITHPSYEPRNLSRIAETNWTLSIIDHIPSVNPPHGGVAVSGPILFGGPSFNYRITAVDDETNEESFPGRSQHISSDNDITGATQANPVKITTSGNHVLANGEEVFIDEMVGMTELNGRKFFITVVSPNEFTLNNEDGTGYGAWTAFGYQTLTYVRRISVGAVTQATPVVLNFPSIAGARNYNIYREYNGVYGYLGTAQGFGTVIFNDIGLLPDTLDTPPLENTFFKTAGDFPSTVAYFQQRKMYGNTVNNPEKVFGSRTASFDNFTISVPLQSTDAVSWVQAGRQVNSVKHMIDLGGLVVFTTGGEWAIKGDPSGILLPGEINPQQISYYGSGDVPPIIVGNTALYLQGRGSIARDLGFDYQVDNFKGNDLSIFASHLFDKNSILDWDYQQIPHSVVWAVRDDGVLLGLTYVREHQIWAWHKHDFAGQVEAVIAIPEGSEDALYLTIKRTINGRVQRTVERMVTRRFASVVDFVGVDCSLSYDGRNSDPSHTMTLTGGTLWTNDEQITLTSSVAFFTAQDIGNEIRLTAADGSQLRLVIEAFFSTSIVIVRPQKNVPVDLQGAAQSTWERAVDEIGGLWHLEGERISILGDGFVIANPNNDSYDVKTVVDGSVTLDRAYAVIHAGLPITSDLYTLDIDTAQGETVVDKYKFVTKVTLFVEESRGIWAGTTPPSSDSSLEGLFELKVRNEEEYDNPVALATGVVEVDIEPGWNRHGRVFIRQTDPLPLSVLALAPAGLVPFGGGG